MIAAVKMLLQFELAKEEHSDLKSLDHVARSDAQTEASAVLRHQVVDARGCYRTNPERRSILLLPNESSDNGNVRSMQQDDRDVVPDVQDVSWLPLRWPLSSGKWSSLYGKSSLVWPKDQRKCAGRDA
jgi:hypothetical protein